MPSPFGRFDAATVGLARSFSCSGLSTAGPDHRRIVAGLRRHAHHPAGALERIPDIRRPAGADPARCLRVYSGWLHPHGALALDLVAPGAGIHAWTGGAIGTMTLAVMSRATLGHTGQRLEASSATQLIYAAVIIAALARVCAVLETDHAGVLLVVAGIAWAVAFLGFAAAYSAASGHCAGSDRLTRRPHRFI